MQLILRLCCKPTGMKDLSLIRVDRVGVEGKFKKKRLWWHQRDDVDMKRERGSEVEAAWDVPGPVDVIPLTVSSW